MSDVTDKRHIIAIGLIAALSIPLFLISRYVWQYDIELVFKLICTYLFLIPAAYIDYRHRIIPNKLLPIGLLITVVFACYDILFANVRLTEKLWSMLIGLGLGAGVFMLASLMSKGGVGMGDIKLFGVLGLMLELQYIFNVLFYTLLCAAICGIIMIAAKKADAKTRIAAAPFALAGMAITILIGG